MSANYRFLPWARSGMAAAAGGGGTARISVSASLRINSGDPVSMQIRLYGPGDVIGLDPRQIVRTDPAPRTADFEPNYFPSVELDRPDLPWLFSPAAADPGETTPKGRLQPWLCLVVVRRQPGVTLSFDPGRPLPSLVIEFPARPADELPDLGEAWAWVHGQVVEDGTESPPLAERLTADSARNLSRLICPRRLDPGTPYLACLVPTFEVGRKAGLGLTITAQDEGALEPAWQGAPERVELPVYHHFEFSTGTEGDFEFLVRRLQHRRLPDQVGSRRMAVGELGFELPGLESAWLQGALRSPTAPVTRIPEDFRDTLRDLLNRRADRDPGEDPLLGPPIYGRWQAGIERLQDGGQSPGWIEELNLDPRHRASAGFGTLLVQDQQEALMTAAWAQLADTRRVNQELRQAQLALQTDLAIHRRHLSRMPAARLLQVTGPAHPKVPAATGDKTTAAVRLRREGLPAAIASTALRRTARGRSPVFRRLHGAPAAPWISRLYQAPLAPPPPPGPGRVTPVQLQDPLNRLEKVAAGKASAVSAEAVKLMKPLLDQRDYLRLTQGLAGVPVRPTRPASQVKQALGEQRSFLLQGVDPAVTLVAKTKARIRAAAPEDAAGLAQGPQAAPEPGPDLAPLVMRAPTFPRPMYEVLRDFSQDLLLPGLELVPPETVTLLQTNPKFVEAFMVGLNHEMGRELLWRRFPTNQRGTCFTRFWDTAGLETDPMGLPPIHTWPLSQPLGGNYEEVEEQDDNGRLVLLIRGELLRRYPGALIYVVRAASATTLDETEKKLPQFRGTLEPDVTFLGFDLTRAEAVGDPGWFFVLEQQPTEPRFGLDVPTAFGLNPGDLQAWAELSWGHLAPDRAAFEAMTHLPLGGALADKILGGITWGLNAAHMAAATLQPPARIAIHAAALIPV
jgi:hypothetical protein